MFVTMNGIYAETGVGTALEDLEDGCRDIVLLAYFFEMSDREIAERLNLIRRTGDLA